MPRETGRSRSFTPAARAFDEAILEGAGPRVAVLLAAGPADAEEQWAAAAAHYRSLGAEPLLVPVLDPSEADAERLPPDYNVFFLGGGDPLNLLAGLAGTTLWKEVLERWRAGRALAGSSAGAMVLCDDCLIPAGGGCPDRVGTRTRAAERSRA